MSDQERYFNKKFVKNFKFTGAVNATETEIKAAAAEEQIWVTDFIVSGEADVDFELNDGTNAYIGEINLANNVAVSHNFVTPVSTGVNKSLKVKGTGAGIINFTVSGYTTP